MLCMCWSVSTSRGSNSQRRQLCVSKFIINTHKHLTNIFCSYTYYDLPPSFDNIEHIQFGLIPRPPFLIYANRQDCLNFKALETNWIDSPVSNEYKTVNKTTLPNISRVASMIMSSWFVDYNAVCLIGCFYLFLT